MRVNLADHARFAWLVAFMAALVLIAAPAAAADERKQMRKTPAGMAAARAVVLKRSDLPPGPGWKGRVTSSVTAAPQVCGTYRPKQSDLVVVGDVDAEWVHAGLMLGSGVQVLQTPRMLRLDWERTVGSPRFRACARKAASQPGDPAWRFVSIRAMAFPRVATYVSAYRGTFDKRREDGTTERLIMDVIFFGSGRTEVTLSTLAEISHAAELRLIEIELAHRLAGRIRV